MRKKLGPVQYRRATLLRLKDVLTTARSKLSAAQRRYRSDSDGKVSFGPVVSAEELVYVKRSLSH